MNTLIPDYFKMLNNNKKSNAIIGGKIDFDNKYINIKPDYFKTLIFDVKNEDVLFKEFELKNENGDYTFMLPTDEDFWMFLGSDHNSVTFYYGENSNIQELKNIIDNEIEKKCRYHLYELGFAYLVWECNNGKSILALYNDNEEGLKLPKEIKKLQLYSVMGGMHADDLIVSEILMSFLYKYVDKNKVAHNFDEEFIQFLKEEIIFEDYIRYAGKKINNKQNKDLYDFSIYLLFKILKYKEIKINCDEPDYVEFFKRLS